MYPPRIIAYRKQVSALLEGVLANEIDARTALNTWPTHANCDPSIQCAYSILWYFEADEDRHGQELFYADVQIKTMMDVSTTLKQGLPLPWTLIREYERAYAFAPPEYSDAWTWREPVWWMINQFRLMRGIIGATPGLNQPAGPALKSLRRGAEGFLDKIKELINPNWVR